MKSIILFGLAVLLGIPGGFFAHEALSPQAKTFGASTFITQQGGTGTSSPSGILYGDNGSTNHLNTVTIGSNLTFAGGTLSATVSGGSGNVATSTAETAGQLSYWTSSGATPATLGKVATGTLSASPPLSVTAGRSVIGGNASLTIDTSGTWSGNAGTATALAANGTNCSAGQAPLGVDASGNSESCFAVATFPYPFPGGATTSAITFSAGLVSNGGSTTIATLTSGLVGNNNGWLYGFASSSLFGYTPLNPTRNINTTFPLSGGGDLSADRTVTSLFSTTSTWGLGSNGFVVVGNAGTPYVAASSTLGLPNTALLNSSVTVNTSAPLGGGGTVSLGGSLSLTCASCSTSTFGFPWTPASNFNANSNSTSTPIWFRAGLYGSTTAQFESITISTTTATSTIAAPLLLGNAVTTQSNLVLVGCGLAYPASVTSGGCMNIFSPSTNLGTAFEVNVSAGASAAGRGIVFNQTNLADAQDFIVASSSATGATTMNIKCQATGKGCLKLEYTGGSGNSNASALSIDMLNGVDSQGIFVKGAASSNAVKLLNIVNSSSATLFNVDQLGNSTTTATAQAGNFYALGSSTFQNFTGVNATTTSFGILNLSASSCDVKSTTAGALFCGTDALGSGAYPFVPTTVYGTTTSATTSPLFLQLGFFASSTSVIASTTFNSFGQVLIGTTSIAVTNPAKVTIDAGSTNTSEEGLLVSGNLNDFYETNTWNTNSGATAQSCTTSTANNGGATSGFISICANSSAFWNPQTYNVGGAGDTSIMGNQTNDLYIDQATSGKKLHFLNGGTSTSTNEVMTFSGLNVGLGTTTPAWPLQINNAGVQLTLGNNAVNNTSFFASNGWLYIASSSLQTLATTTFSSISISPNGQVSLLETAVGTSTTMSIDWNATPNQVDVQMGAAAMSIAFTNASTSGMTKRVIVCNPNGAAGALSWAIPILWAGGAAPTQTTTANKCDVYSFLVSQASSTSKTTTKVLGTGTASF